MVKMILSLNDDESGEVKDIIREDLNVLDPKYSDKNFSFCNYFGDHSMHEEIGELLYRLEVDGHDVNELRDLYNKIKANRLTN